MNIRFKKEDIVLVTVAVIVIIAFSCSIFVTKHRNNSRIVTSAEKQINNNSIKTGQGNSEMISEATTTTEWRCLGDDEEVEYKISKKEKEQSTATIIVKDKNTGREKIFSFGIINPNHYHPIEIHRCGVYAARSFNYDYKSRKSLAGYKAEMWKYDYSGIGEKIVLLDEDLLGNMKGYKHYYSDDFRVSLDEKYIILVQDYLGQNNYSLVIKDLNTKEDVLVLKLADITKRYPKIIGNFGFLDWKENGRYFWTDIFQGANALGYVRIDSDDWSWEAYETPDNHLAGFGPNFKTGWMPYVPSAVWTGAADITEEIRQEAKERGQTSILYLYNLFTKEQFQIYETSIDPIWDYGLPAWISDTELEYELPGGEKRIYKLK